MSNYSAFPYTRLHSLSLFAILYFLTYLAAMRQKRLIFEDVRHVPFDSAIPSLRHECSLAGGPKWVLAFVNLNVWGGPVSNQYS